MSYRSKYGRGTKLPCPGGRNGLAKKVGKFGSGVGSSVLIPAPNPRRDATMLAKVCPVYPPIKAFHTRG